MATGTNGSAPQPVTKPAATPPAPAAWPAGAQFQLGDRVLAVSAKRTGIVTKAMERTAGIVVYEIKYEHNGVRATWFDYQLKAAPLAKKAGA